MAEKKPLSGKMHIASFDDLFGGAAEDIQMIPIKDLHQFHHHPFRVIEDESMTALIESVKENGILTPAIARKRKEGGYELISGHRRRRAAELAGLEAMPVCVRELDDDEAVITLVDANLQREKILPSEKAKAYKMKMDALRHQGQRTDLTSCHADTKAKRSDEMIGESVGESARTVQRYIRLNELPENLLERVDDRSLPLSSAVELSYLTSDEKEAVSQVMEEEQVVPTKDQAKRLRLLSDEERCSKDAVYAVLSEEKKPERKITLTKERINRYFPEDMSVGEIEEVIIRLLEGWKGGAVDDTV